jgi:hypothetical protein
MLLIFLFVRSLPSISLFEIREAVHHGKAHGAEELEAAEAQP